MLLWWISVSKFTGRQAGIKLLSKHSLLQPRPVVHGPLPPADLMTKLKNEWAIAKILKGLGILERALYPGNLPLLALQ